MGLSDILKRRKKKKGDNGPSSNPSSAEVAVSKNSTSAQEAQESQSGQTVPFSQNVEPVTASDPPTKTLPQGPQSSIWIDAYTKLKEEEEKLVERYEKIITNLNQEDSFEENAIEEAPSHIEKPAQMQNMDKLIQLGLRRTEKETKLKGRFGEMTRLINIVKPVVDKAVKPSPEAALVWSCFSFGLEVLANPVTEFEAQRSGVEYVISRLDWYLYLSESVLSGGKTPLGLQESLHKKLIGLYKQLLGFLVKSICLYHQSRLLVTMRDLFKYDNWESQVKSIKDDEVAVERDLDQYNATEFRNGLEAISTTATGILEELEKWRDEERDDKCRTVIAKTIPFFTKARLLDEKGGLFPECCDWLFSSDKFKQWKNEPESRVMWISGAAGKGKTMLLCAIAEWFQYSRCLAYFFCKETDERLNNEAAILRGIIYSITEKMPALLKHAQDNIDGLRQDGADGTQALCTTLKLILADPFASDAVILIDALDECTQNDSNEDEAPGGILRLIAELATNSSAKWVISSRNTLSAVDIQLGSTPGFLHLNLDDSTHSISDAVAVFVRMKVATFCQYIQIGSKSQNDIVDQLILRADETFLWVSLVLSDILKTLRNKRVPDPVGFILKQIQEMPESLDGLYKEILKRAISEADSKDGIDVRDILKVVYLVYRPLTIQELQYLIEYPDIRLQKNPNELRILFHQASAFLTIKDTVISFVHQSAKDFITKHGSDSGVAILPEDKGLAHREVFYRSMANISELKENIFDIEDPGMKMNELIRPDWDPLVPAGYSCTHWAYHLLLSNSPVDMEIQERVYSFLSKHLLRWMEALAWIEELPAGEELLEKVKGWVPDGGKYDLQSWINDAYRFYVKFCPVVMETPLQVYASALIFAPLTSLVKKANRSPEWITHISGISETWDPCAVTMEEPNCIFKDLHWHNNHRLVSCMIDYDWRFWLAYWSTKIGSCIRRSPSFTNEIYASKSGQVFAGFDDHLVQVWDAAMGSLRNYEVDFTIDAMALSSNGKYLLATCPNPPRLHIWDMTGLPGEADSVSWEYREVQGQFKPNVEFITETLFVLAFDETIDVEDVEGKRWHRLEAGGCVRTLTPCSGDSVRFVTSDDFNIFKIWDALTGECLGKFHVSTEGKWQVAPDGSMFVFTKNTQSNGSDFGSELLDSESESSSGDSRSLDYESGSSVIELYYLPANPPTVSLEIDCGERITGLAFSNNNKMLASAIDKQYEISIWDIACGKRLMVFRGHTAPIIKLSFSPDNRRLASSTDDSVVKIWDLAAAEAGTVESSIRQVSRMGPSVISFSPDGQSLCTVEPSSVPRIWSNKGPEPCVSQKGKLWNRTWSVTSEIFFSPDSSKFGLNLQTNALEVWSALKDECCQICTLGTKELELSSITDISFSNKGNLMAVGSNGSLTVWSLDYQKCVSVLNLGKFGKSSWRTTTTRFLKDDHHLISSTDSGFLIISDVNGVYRRTVKGHKSDISALEVTSQRLISSTHEDVKIWDITSPRDMTLVSSFDISDETYLRLWNLGNNNSLLSTHLGILSLNQPTQESSGPLGSAMLTQFRGYGINEERTWVTKDGKDILWLPEEYRPYDLERQMSIWGSMVAIARKAELLVIHFSED